MHTVESLQRFEQEIADIYATGVIPYPVHLRASPDGVYEKNLIEIFKQVQPNDYVFSYWDSHIVSLLKGVSEENLKRRIMDGDSISLCFPEYKIFCSGIVGSLCGVATGTAWALKQAGSSNKVVHYCGDMSAFQGIFREAVEYSVNFDLPILWVVGDNDHSVTTKTKETWNSDEFWFQNTRYMGKMVYFRYSNTYFHSGIQKNVAF